VIALTAAVTFGVIAGVVALATIGLALAGRRRVATTGAALAGLVGFFAVWTAGIDRWHGTTGVLLFVAAIATFRAMNFFERSRDR
jgi:hypothetical protein